jgi:hypothetical protein
MKRIYFLSDVSAVKHNGSNITKLLVNGATAWLGGGVTYSYSGGQVNTSTHGRSSLQTTFAVSQKPDVNNQFVVRTDANCYVSDPMPYNGNHSVTVSAQFYASGRDLGVHSVVSVASSSTVGGNSSQGAKNASGSTTSTFDAHGVSMTHSILHVDYTNNDNQGCSCWGNATHVLFP